MRAARNDLELKRRNTLRLSIGDADSGIEREKKRRFKMMYELRKRISGLRSSSPP